MRQHGEELAAQARRYVEQAFDVAMGGAPSGIKVLIVVPDGRVDDMHTATGRRDLLVLGGRTRRRPS